MVTLAALLEDADDDLVYPSFDMGRDKPYDACSYIVDNLKTLKACSVGGIIIGRCGICFYCPYHSVAVLNCVARGILEVDDGSFQRSHGDGAP